MKEWLIETGLANDDELAEIEAEAKEQYRAEIYARNAFMAEISRRNQERALTYLASGEQGLSPRKFSSSGLITIPCALGGPST